MQHTICRVIAPGIAFFSILSGSGFGQIPDAIAKSGISELVVSGQWKKMTEWKPTDAVSQFAVATAFGVMEQWDRMHEEAGKTDGYRDGPTQISAFLQALAKESPQNANVHFMMGTYYLKREPDHAINELEAAVQANPQFAPAHYNLASIYQERGDTDKRLASLRKAVQADPNYASAYWKMAGALVKKRNYNEALRCYEQCDRILISRGSPKGSMPGDLYYNWGWLYVNGPTRDDDKGLQLLTKSIEAYPKLSEAYNERGVVYKRKQMYDRAIPDYKNALALDPKNVSAHFNLGVAYFRSGNTAEARISFQRTIELDPSGDLGSRARQFLSQM